MIRLKAAVAALSVLALPLAGCNPSQPAAQAETAAPAAADPAPPEAAQAAFAGCQWGKVTGSGLSVWSYACGPAMSGQSLVPDEEVGGFALISDGLEPSVVIRSFAKPVDAAIDAALPAIRAASPGPHTATCVLTPMTVEGRDPVYLLSPTGAAKTQWDGVEAGKITTGDTTPPCGDLGVGFVGDRYFQVLKAAPTKVVYVDAGSEIQIFDPSTLAAD